MSDSASRKTEPQASKVAQSQVANQAEQPSIGDLSAIQSEIETPTSNPHSIGDMENVDAATNSDVLGDITLLEEAFAEMEDSAEDQDDDIPMLNSTIEQPSVNPLAEKQNASHSIPVLDQQATEFVQNSMPAANSENVDIEDIPTLATNTSMDNKPLSEPKLDNVSQQSEFSLSDIENLNEPATDAGTESTPTISENLEIPDVPTLASNSVVESKLHSESEPSADKESQSKLATEIPTTISSQSDFSLSDLDNPAEAATEASQKPVVTTFDAVDDEGFEALISAPIPETLASEENLWADSAATSKPTTMSTPEPQLSTIDNLPPSEPLNSQTTEPSHSAFSTSAINFDSNSATPSNHEELTDSKISGDVFTNDSIPSTVEEKIAKATGETTSSGFHDIPLANEHVSAIPETELAPGFIEDMAQSQFNTPAGELLPQSNESNAQNSDTPMNMSIPFELHSQLSKKIDELVLDATMSLTNELEQQLSLRLESLLGNAVESVLPKLVDQMANELRAEVKGRIKQQLPIMVNDVLGKTRLS